MPDALVGHDARTHHRFSPSRLNYLDRDMGGCPGHRQDPSSSAAADEGTELHERMEKLVRDWLKHEVHDEDGFITLSEFVEVNRNWDDEIHGYLMYCANYLEGLLHPGVQVFVELSLPVHIDKEELTR